MNYKGKAHKVGEHIDTDAIIPARFLVTTDAKKLGENCMSGLEPDWVCLLYTSPSPRDRG